MRAHWLVLIAVLFALGVALAVQGYMHHLAGIGDDAVPSSTSATGVPDAVSGGGPVVDSRGGAVRTVSPPDHTLALTFDDGPDPVWTPQILDVLRKHHVRATFFVVGSAAIDHPDLMRRIIADGHEIGVHTLTHTDLGTAPSWRRDLEVQGAQEAIAGITGHATSLLRPPYSSGNDAINDSAWSAMRTSADEGYITVLSTVDSEDWRRPGATAIERNLAPSGTKGQVLLMHDGGGDREQTVAALDSALSRFAGQGYRVTSVGDAIGIDSMREASAPEQTTGTAFVRGIQLSDFVVTAISWGLVAAGIVTFVRAVLVVGFAARHSRAARRLQTVSRGRRRMDVPVRPEITEPVVVIVPAYNEERRHRGRRPVAGRQRLIRVEVIVVDDGSTDGTADIVEALGLPGVRVIRQPNGGKPAALNTGIAAARHDLVVMVDGDTVFEPDTVRPLVQPFADPRGRRGVAATPRSATGAACSAAGSTSSTSSASTSTGGCSTSLQCMPTVPGAIGAFRRRRAARGRRGQRRHARRGHRPDDGDLPRRLAGRLRGAAPAPGPRRRRRSAQLWRQRYRWCYGTMQAMWKHRGALVRARRGGPVRPARPAATCSLFQVLLPLLAPVVDVFAVYGLLFLDPLRDRRPLAGLRWSSQVVDGAVRLPARPASRSGRCGRCRSSSSSTGS